MPRAAGLALAAALGPFGGTGLAVEAAAAQTRATLDAGASYVEYEGFLPSAAFSLTPALSVAGRHLGLLARATWLQFESGNHSVQAVLAGALSLPASPGVVAELGAELGGSRYEDIAHFSHLLGRARLRIPGARATSGWLGGTVGAAESDDNLHSVWSFAGAVEHRTRDLGFTLTGSTTFVGATSYVDVEAAFRHARRSGFETAAAVSLRGGDPNGDPGPYLEASLTLPVATHAAVVLAGGRYAVDVIRGNVAGRYLSAALRLTAPLRRRPLTVALASSPPADGGATVSASLLEIRRGRGEQRTLVFRAPGATTLEVMGDFTDWVPTPLQPAGPDRWIITLSVAPGRHRLNLRVDGGPWGVPAGTTPMSDDFLGMVGAVIIP